MPANYSNQIVYINTGNPETMNETTLYKGGELGQRLVTTDGKQYQLVRLDSGATASTGAGVVADNDLAFWKDKTNYLVTNDIAQALGAENATLNNKRNNVAGVFHTAVTAGSYCWIQEQGLSDVASDGGADFTIGDYAIAANGTSAQIDRMAAGTAPTHTVVGIVAGTESANVTEVDLNLPAVP